MPLPAPPSGRFPAVDVLGRVDAPALAALAAREDVVRFGDHLATDPLERWAEWIGPAEPDRALTLAARDGEGLVAAAKLTLVTRRRRNHAAVLELVASADDDDAAVAALVDAVVATADAWLQVDRIELRIPAGHPRIDGLLKERGFERETRLRVSLRTDGALVDEEGLGRLRPGVASPTRPPEPLPLPVPPPGPRPPVTIRRIAVEDAPALAAMMSDPAVVWGTLQTPHQRPELWAERIPANDPARIVFLGAEVDGALVGNGALMLQPALRRRHVGGIGMMVASAAQGRGVGRAILDALLASADELGLARVELDVYPDNERAVRLYESAGFVHEGRQRAEAFRDGAFVDALAMARVREPL